MTAFGRGATQFLSLSEACSEGGGGKAITQVSGPQGLGRKLKEQDLGEE